MKRCTLHQLAYGAIMAAAAALIVVQGSGCKTEVKPVTEAPLADSTVPQDLVTNGGFEPVGGSMDQAPYSWFATRVARTSEHMAFIWDSTVAHSGKRSVAITINQDHPNDKIAYNWTQGLQGWEAGKTYQLTGWVKTRGLSGPAWICVQSWDSTREKMLGFETTQTAYPVSGTTDWTEVKTNFTVPAQTREVVIRAGSSSPENRNGTVWYDDIHVTAK